MFNDITIGQYVSGNSPLHKMDARFKIILTILYIIILFLIERPLSYIVFTIFAVTLVMISTVPVRYVMKGLKPLLWIFIFTAVLNLFLTPGETVLTIPVFKSTFTITKEGIKTAVLLVIRLVLLMTGSSLLTLTTSPLQLTDGIEKLLKPLNRFGISSHETAMIMTIAIRFIPTLSEEADKITKAQKARGADFESGGLFKRAKALLPVLIPLFVSAFRRADELATAMESRCYRGGNNRTRMKESRISATDIKAGAVFVLCVAILFTAELIIEI